MQTSLKKTKDIDNYLLQQLYPADRLLFEAKLLIDQQLATEVSSQQAVLEYVKAYGRQNLKEEVMAVQKKILNAPQHQNFIQRVARLFKKK